jgi:hypothetical protein
MIKYGLPVVAIVALVLAVASVVRMTPVAASVAAAFGTPFGSVSTTDRRCGAGGSQK